MTTLKTTLKWWNHPHKRFLIIIVIISVWKLIQLIDFFFFQPGNTDFLEKEHDAVNSILHDCIETEPTACNKETGTKQRLQKWSRGHLFMVRGGGIIDKWSPLFKWVWMKNLSLNATRQTRQTQTRQSQQTGKRPCTFTERTEITEKAPGKTDLPKVTAVQSQGQHKGRRWIQERH